MTHQFSQVPSVEIPRSSFNRSHGLKTTFSGGLLVPIFCDEALPGDTFNLKMSAFARLATPIFPIMDNLHMETFFFAVPNRLIWENWQRFNGEEDEPGGTGQDFMIPQLDVTGGYATESLSDYFGLPTNVANARSTSMFHRAFNLIWNEWFRDQNLQDKAIEHIDDGPDPIADYPMRRRGKRHDYFTSCLPWPQKGDPVELPIGGFAPVISSASGTGGSGQPRFNISGGASNLHIENRTDLSPAVRLPDGQSDEGILTWSTQAGATGLETDLGSATAVTVNTMRQAFQIQRLQERDARGGTRYTEILRAHFGVVSPDSRLQRPEYLGGGSSPVIISPVAQTSSTQDSQGPVDTPQGNLAAIGTASLTGHGFTQSFTEHCTIIGLISVRADLTYQQGTPRMFSRRSRFDFYWPVFSNLGEQSVLNKEIFTQGDDGSGTPEAPVIDNQVFGYQERSAEYRYKQSLITGLFRSENPTSLDSWHLSQDFENLPVLDSDFIEDNPPIDRIIAVQDEPHFIFDAYFNFQCARPMPLYGVPGLIDHF